MEESPPYERKKSNYSRDGSIYKNNIGMVRRKNRTRDFTNCYSPQVESPYEVKSEHSHKTQDDKSDKQDSASDEESNKNGNPFETLDDD